MKPLFNTLNILLTAFTLMGCSAPKTYLDDYIKDKGYIPYALQVDDTSVGTFYEGSNQNLQLVQEAEFCMPDRTFEPFRKVQNTSLPKEYRKIQLGFDAHVDDALKSGTASVSLNLSASHVKSVEIEFGAASVESLIKNNLMEHYKNGMSIRCRSLLENNAFITKSLRVESMKFKFESISGGFVDLEADLDQVVHIDADARWSVEDKYTLVISSPKAIGYNMAKLNSEGTLEYAVKTDAKNHWIFKKASELFTTADGD